MEVLRFYPIAFYIAFPTRGNLLHMVMYLLSGEKPYKNPNHVKLNYYFTMFLLFISSSLYVLAFFLSLVFYYGRVSRYVPFALMFLALSFYLVSVLSMGLREGGFPFGDVYGFYSLLGNMMTAVILVFSMLSPQISRFYAILAFAGFLSTLLAIPSEPSQYRGLLYSLHILFAVLSYTGAFLGSFSSLLKSILEDKLKHKDLSGFFLPIGTLMFSERVFLNVTFVMFTFTLIFGSFWSRSFLGKHWIDDPKLFSTFLLWSYYAVLIHLNTVKLIKPKRFSQLSLLGGVITLLNLLFVRHEL